MSGPILVLRAAILSHLSGDAELATLMGGTVRLYDEPPRAAEPVYAVFGDAAAPRLVERRRPRSRARARDRRVGEIRQRQDRARRGRAHG